MTKQQQGGKSAKVGRPLLYDKRMVRKSVCLPEEWVARLQEDFDSFSTGIRAIIRKYFERKGEI